MAGDAASRRGVNRAVGVAAAGGAFRGAAFDVFVDFGVNGSRARALLFLQRPLLLRAVNLAEVVDTGVLLGGGTGFDEVGDRDRSEEADDGHDDHDFNEGEAGFTIGSINMHGFQCRCEPGGGGLLSVLKRSQIAARLSTEGSLAAGMPAMFLRGSSGLRKLKTKMLVPKWLDFNYLRAKFASYA